jgi:hypothetical protein
MLRNSLVRHTGLWDKRPPERWEVEKFDAQIADAINGDDGESFDAETQIVIGGDGMQITAPFRAAQCTYAALVNTIQVEYTSRSRQRFMRLDRAIPQIPSGWSLGDPTPPDYIWSRSNSTWIQLEVVDDDLWVPLRLPVGAVLTEVTMTIRGGNQDPGTNNIVSHAGAPSVMPRIDVMRADHDAFAPSSVGGQTDTYVSAVAYEAAHAVTQSGMSHTILANRKYWARIRGESGTNSLERLRVFSVRATCDLTLQDEWIV